MASGAEHLSAICQSGDLQLVLAKLRAMTGEGGDETMDFLNTCDGDGRTALHWSIALRSWALAETLMAEPYLADTNTRDQQTTTPLMTACSVDTPAPLFVKLLERSLPVVDATSDVGNNALILAASRGNVTAVRALLKHTQPQGLMHQNNSGQSALHRAVSKNSAETVEEIVAAARKAFPEKLQLRVFLNLPDKNGDTALHYASMENNQEIGQFLIRSGADKERRNKAGKQFWEV